MFWFVEMQYNGKIKLFLFKLTLIYLLTPHLCPSTAAEAVLLWQKIKLNIYLFSIAMMFGNLHKTTHDDDDDDADVESSIL